MRPTKTVRIFGIPGESRQAEKGFVLIAALMAVLLLTALGVLVFTVTTQDVRISSRLIGERKAFSAAESGIGSVVQKFDPANLGTCAATNEVVDASIDPDSRYSIPIPAVPTSGPAAIPASGYSIGGGEVWGQTRYITTVTGQNTRYGSRLPITVGIGHGPVEMTTNYR
jgi:Tfp pilus assembly protein PilX